MIRFIYAIELNWWSAYDEARCWCLIDGENDLN